MRRILLLTTLAAMLAAAMALSGVAQAKPNTSSKADIKCFAEANKTLQPGFNYADYTFHGGTAGDDNTFTGTAGPDVFCGFGGVDVIETLEAGDIFLGGAGNDHVITNEGTFNGEAGNDIVDFNDGTFNGGEGNDHVSFNAGTFNGGDGDDTVVTNAGSTSNVEHGV
jgi:Ca2+-binding RTX toxin-like protein